MRINKGAAIDQSARIAPGVYIGARSVIGPDTVVNGGVTIYEDVVIGRGVIIEQSATIREKSVIGDRCVIAKYAQLFPNTVLADQVKIGPWTKVSGSIGRGITIEWFSKIDEKSFIRDECIIGPNVHLFPNTTLAARVKIGPWAKVSGHWLISPFYKQLSEDLLYATSPGDTPIKVVITVGDESQPLEDWLALSYKALKAKLLDTWSPTMVREVQETLHQEVLPWARAAGERGEL